MCRASPVNRLTCLVRILQTVFKTFIQRIGKAMRMKVIDLRPRPHAPNAAAENFHYLPKISLFAQKSSSSYKYDIPNHSQQFK